jgi:hypothetical protein
MKIPYSNTTIAPERTKAEIEKMLHEYGIADVQWTTYKNQTTLRFIWHLIVKGVEKEIMFQFTPPIIPAAKRTWTGMRYEKVNVRLDATAYRLLWHYLKNKLEAVRWGLESMEKEFLSHAVVSLPNGTVATVGDKIDDVLESARLEVVKVPSLEYQKDEGKTIDVEGAKS